MEIKDYGVMIHPAQAFGISMAHSNSNQLIMKNLSELIRLRALDGFFNIEVDFKEDQINRSIICHLKNIGFEVDEDEEIIFWEVC